MLVDILNNFWQASGLVQIEFKPLMMILVSALLIYLAIAKKYEPLLLLPIGFGGLLVNLPGSTLGDSGSVFNHFYNVGIETGLFPLLIFLCLGTLTDFRPMLSRPITLLYGAAAQFGIFFTFMGALFLSDLGVFDFSVKQAASIAIIGGADGPTAIYISSKLAPEILAAVAVVAYSYMSLVPIIQPPIMRLLTTQKERTIEMLEMKKVSRLTRILFPIMLVIITSLLIPSALPLVGMFCIGNLMRESKVVDRLVNTCQNAFINIVTILLGLAVGTKMEANNFLQYETLGILLLGALAFIIGTASGIIMVKITNLFCKKKLNPLIGAAGVSAVPMAARTVNKVGLESNPHNVLLMHAMGPNVAGVLGSAIVAGLMISYLQ